MTRSQNSIKLVGTSQIPKLKYDKPLNIAVGNNLFSKSWQKKELLWSELLERLRSTKITAETVAEYEKMGKDKQKKIKDQGGFLGGTLNGAQRNKSSVSERSLLTFDMDHAPHGAAELLREKLDYNWALHSTHRHTPDQPRYRLVIPLAYSIEPEKYAPLSRMVASIIGIEFFDSVSFSVTQMMYWPTTPSDGEFVFEHNDAEFINPDQFLSQYKDWKCVASWPKSERENKALHEAKKQKQEDPELKKGVIGAFCRVYDINAAVLEFLDDVYEEAESADRYTYMPGTTTSGLVVYDNGKFAYSHHSSDPACGRLCNAWDLVRIHKFGHLDDSKRPDTPVYKLPSQLEMEVLANSDCLVKKQLAADMFESAPEDFAAFPEIEKLEWDKKGNLKPTLENLLIILKHDPKLKGIAYNEFSGALVLTSPVPWRDSGSSNIAWQDLDDSHLRIYLESRYTKWPTSKIIDALFTVGWERRFHPIRDYLNSLPKWDGVKRLDTLLIDWLGAFDSPYVRAVTRKTLVAAVARVMQPGIKFDYLLIIAGNQGLGKSTLFARLGGRWHQDSLSLNDMASKEGPEKIREFWIVEIAELSGLRKAEIESVKSFISREADVYRESYGRRAAKYPRQCILVGTTNADAFLRDSTGNRRFWPVRVKGAKPGRESWTIEQTEIDQVWAEALYYWNRGEKLYLEGKTAVEALDQQKAAMEDDPRLGIIEEYLERDFPADWGSRTTQQRLGYLVGDFHNTDPNKEPIKLDRICVVELWEELFSKGKGSIKNREAAELHALMGQIKGWKSYEGSKSKKLRFPNHGMQRAYVRCSEPQNNG